VFKFEVEKTAQISRGLLPCVARVLTILSAHMWLHWTCVGLYITVNTKTTDIIYLSISDTYHYDNNDADNKHIGCSGINCSCFVSSDEFIHACVCCCVLCPHDGCTVTLPATIKFCSRLLSQWNSSMMMMMMI